MAEAPRFIRLATKPMKRGRSEHQPGARSACEQVHRQGGRMQVRQRKRRQSNIDERVECRRRVVGQFPIRCSTTPAARQASSITIAFIEAPSWRRYERKLRVRTPTDCPRVWNSSVHPSSAPTAALPPMAVGRRSVAALCDTWKLEVKPSKRNLILPGARRSWPNSGAVICSVSDSQSAAGNRKTAAVRYRARAINGRSSSGLRHTFVACGRFG